MSYYPNQKRIKITRNIPKSGTKMPYLCIYNDTLEMAMKNLSPAQFKVYIYLLMNADGFYLDFSPSHAAEITGLNKDTVRKSLYVLQDKDYITDESEDPFYPRYVFHEFPAFKLPEKDPFIIDWD